MKIANPFKGLKQKEQYMKKTILPVTDVNVIIEELYERSLKEVEKIRDVCEEILD